MWILLSVCLVADPGTCREERINFSVEPASAMVCMARSQSLIAEWHSVHPGWHVDRWRCTARGAAPDRA